MLATFKLSNETNTYNTTYWEKRVRRINNILFMDNLITFAINNPRQKTFGGVKQFNKDINMLSELNTFDKTDKNWDRFIKKDLEP